MFLHFFQLFRIRLRQIVLFPGNSGYQYDDRRFIHQLNWDTNGAVKGACYWIRVYSGKTWQINDQTEVRVETRGWTAILFGRTCLEVAGDVWLAP